MAYNPEYLAPRVVMMNGVLHDNAVENQEMNNGFFSVSATVVSINWRALVASWRQAANRNAEKINISRRDLFAVSLTCARIPAVVDAVCSHRCGCVDESVRTENGYQKDACKGNASNKIIGLSITVKVCKLDTECIQQNDELYLDLFRTFRS